MWCGLAILGSGLNCLSPRGGLLRKAGSVHQGHFSKALSVEEKGVFISLDGRICYFQRRWEPIWILFFTGYANLLEGCWNQCFFRFWSEFWLYSRKRVQMPSVRWVGCKAPGEPRLSTDNTVSQRRRLPWELIFWGFHQISAQYLVHTDGALWNMLILFFHFYTISLPFPFQIQ